MSSPISSRMQQVHLARGSADYSPIWLKKNTDVAVYAGEHDDYEAILLRKCPANIWPGNTYARSCPRPILMGTHHHNQLTALHEALVIAIVDIVQRWWSDDVANFPQRMPLQEDEETLLKWLDDQVQNGTFPAYSKSTMGSCRPDFLVQDDDGKETFCLSEINARFSFNGFMHAQYGQEALDEICIKDPGLSSAAEEKEFLSGLLNLFHHDRPLHLLKGVERGYDIEMVIRAIKLKLGTTPRLITPADLRLVPDPEQPGQKKLCCLAKPSSAPSTAATLTSADGEALEEIHQVGLELHQHELAALDPETRRQISLRCFNDMRTILLVHDKRMLGVVRQEAPSLVARGVLTPAQEGVLLRGIAETMLPGSSDMQQLLCRSRADPAAKDGYLLKPVRGGKGAGILFGEDLSPERWLTALGDLQRSSSQLSASTSPSCVVQRKVRQHVYDLVLERSGEMRTQPIVGTYHSVHGRYLGIGIWRSSDSRICALSAGGSWICSVIKDQLPKDETK